MGPHLRNLLRTNEWRQHASCGDNGLIIAFSLNKPLGLAQDNGLPTAKRALTF
jgi:hypothetical protein